MKKIGSILFLLFVLIISCRSKKQVVYKNEVSYIPYYLKVYEADSLFVLKEYSKSYSILDSLFKEYQPVNLIIYDEVLSYIKLKIILNKKIKDKELLRLISFYGYNKEFISNDSIFKSTKKQNLLLSNYESLRAIYINNIDLKLRNEIKGMKSEDQFYRKNDYESNIDKQTVIDLKNQKRIMEIFDNYGFPNQKKTGVYNIDKSDTDTTVILLHTKDSVRKQYFMPKIYEYVKLGEASPELYANLYDQFLLYNGKEQYYGSYENKVEIPINELNKRRKKIGLPSYGYEEWRSRKLYPQFFK
jgi:hypothetical protein